MTGSYNLKNIRTLLTEGFTDAELRCFCFDVPEFRPVYERLSQQTGKDSVIHWIIERAERQMLFEIILAWAKKNNPARYQVHQPYVGHQVDVGGKSLTVSPEDILNRVRESVGKMDPKGKLSKGQVEDGMCQ